MSLKKPPPYTLKPGDIRAVHIGKEGGILLTLNHRSLGEYHPLSPETTEMFVKDLRAIVDKAIGKEDE